MENRLIKIIFLSLLILVYIPVNAYSQDLNIYNDLRMGKYYAGFELSYITDSSRTYKNKKRTIQVSTWYPAEMINDAWQMTLGDYVDLIASETNPYENSKSKKDLAVNAYAAHHASFGANIFKLKRILLSRVYADKGLPRKEIKFPLIFFVQGRSDSPAQNFAMCEYLSSNGFVVVSIPAIGINKRELDFNDDELRSQIQDQEFLYNYVTTNFKNIDKNKIFYIGYSYGSMTSLFLSMKNKNVKAVVSMDGSIGFSDRFDLIKNYPGFDSVKFKTPLLHLNSFNNERNDLSLIKALESDKKYVLSFGDFDHADFTSFGLLSIYENIMRERRSENFRIAQLYMYDYILDFLNMNLNNDKKAASKFLSFHRSRNFPKELIKFQVL